MREVEARGERDGAQHPDRIFLDARFGIADRSDDARAEILEAADVVDDRERRDVVEERVDREVAPERVFFGRAERVVVMNETLGRPAVDGSGAGTPSATTSSPGATWRRNVATSMTFVAELDVRQAEAPADDPAVPEELLDLLGVRRRADVEVFGPPAEQQVADAAADEVGDVIRPGAADRAP